MEEAIILYGLWFGLLFGLRSASQSITSDIRTVEALKLSWKRAIKIGVLGALGGLIAFPLSMIVGSLWIPYYVTLGGLLGIVLGGFRGSIVKTKTYPNQGVYLSLKNSLFLGSFLGAIVGAILFLLISIYIDHKLEDLLHNVLLPALSYAGILALWYGGLDVIQHYTLRLILITQGHTPRNYARFLDYAVDRIFLQKVGGGYRFIHRMLLEHFAKMYEEKP